MTTTADPQAIDNINSMIALCRVTGRVDYLHALAAMVNSIAAQTPPEHPNPALSEAVTTVLQSGLSDTDAAVALSIPVDDVTVGRRVSAMLATANADAHLVRAEMRAAMDNLTAA